MEDDAQRAATLQDFLAVTGVDDPGAAAAVLEATGWNLEEAVNLQFATGGDLGAGAPPRASGGAAAAGAGSPPPDIPPELMEEEQVRAPLPVVRDRLYGDHHGVPARPARYGAGPDRGPAHVDVFRDFAPQPGGEDALLGAGGSGAAAAAPSGSAAAGGGAPKLSDLFKPPAGLLFAGSWEEAKAHAAQQGRWLLANVQSADEFATHRLNRDTWGQPLVQDMLRGTFVFWQVYNTADQGQALIRSYQLERLPCVLIVDPITGAKLWERAGFVSAEALVEEMVPFMDAGPNDPGASALAQRAYQQSAKRRNRGTAGFGGGSGGGDVGAMSEDEQLALALAMSTEQPAAGAAAGEEEDLDEEAIWREVQRRQQEEQAKQQQPQRQQPQQHLQPQQQQQQPAAATEPQHGAQAPAAVDVAAVQAAAAARLPPEPADGAAGSCRVAFRLPNGSRVQRRFDTQTDTVATLQDFCVSVSAEAAALPSFHLAEARPGAAPLSDPATTLAAAGVAGAMLVLRTS